MKFADDTPKAPANLDTILHFGKFKGHTVQQVIDEEPSYIVWCADNIEWFDIEPFVYDMAVEKDAGQNYDPDYDGYPAPHWSDDPYATDWFDDRCEDGNPLNYGDR